MSPAPPQASGSRPGGGGEGFPRALRLLRPAEFRDVFDHGRSASDRWIIVYARPRAAGGPPRLGLVVGRRFGRAHLRNAWKRRMREAFRRSRAALPPSHDLVVLPARPGAVPPDREARESRVRTAGRAARAFSERGPR